MPSIFERLSENSQLTASAYGKTSLDCRNNKKKPLVKSAFANFPVIGLDGSGINRAEGQGQSWFQIRRRVRQRSEKTFQQMRRRLEGYSPDKLRNPVLPHCVFPSLPPPNPSPYTHTHARTHKKKGHTPSVRSNSTGATSSFSKLRLAAALTPKDEHISTQFFELEV